ncbi:MAG: signal peptidase I, partial [Slackia piriformis]|nr:signal peptidase I [Slackia piriformis]
MSYGQHATPRSRGVLRTVLSGAGYVALVIALVWGLQTFVACPYNIPSGSMEDTIEIGDNVWSEKVSYYFRDIEPGDIVTFNDPEIPNRTLIKRVIATGGQTVDLLDGVVYVDGVAL